jgi:hypothetical protein
MNRKVSKKSKHPDILLIPRREVDLIPCESGSPLFFIYDRKKTYTRRIDTPSSISKSGISSGIRSVIIFDDDEGYIKLKGVKPLLTSKEKNYGGGLLSQGENEIEHLQKSTKGKQYIGTTPFIKFTVGIKLRSQHISHINMIYKEKYIKAKNSNTYKIDARISESYDKYKLKTDVFGFKIEADTRLDEIIYALTSERHQTRKRKDVNDLLVRLCENGATIYSKLLLSGAVFETMPRPNTNTHIGNIVNYAENGLIKEKIVDLGTSEKVDMTKSVGGKLAEAVQLFYSFKWDFEDEHLFSIPYMTYKHFSIEQRKMCSKAFYDSYIKFLEKFAKSNVSYKEIPKFLKSINGHDITKEELDHYINDQVIYQ